MRKSIILTLGLLLTAGLVAAQDFHYSVYMGSGIGIPMSSALKDSWNSGEVFEVGFGRMIQPNLEIFARFGYSHFRPDEENYIKDIHAFILDQTGEDYDVSKMGFGGGGDAHYYMFAAGAKYYIPSAKSGGVFNPYFLVSAGLEKQEIANPELVFYGNLLYLEMDMGYDEIGFLGNAGAGIDFDFGGGFNVFIEGKYALHFVDPENTQSFPLTAGFKIALGMLE